MAPMTSPDSIHPTNSTNLPENGQTDAPRADAGRRARAMPSHAQKVGSFRFDLLELRVREAARLCFHLYALELALGEIAVGSALFCGQVSQQRVRLGACVIIPHQHIQPRRPP